MGYRDRTEKEILEGIEEQLEELNANLQSIDKTLVALVEQVMNK